MKSSGKILLGVLAGMAAGAVLGILFAPDKGEVTRKKVVKKADDYADGLKEKFNDLLDNLAETIETAKDKAGKVADDAKSKVEDAKA